MLKLLIADAGEEYRLALTEQLKNSYTIRLCVEGKEALEAIRSFEPDVMILDLMLPGMDGISLLRRAAAEGRHPVVLATTRFANDYVLRSVEALGVGYLMVKPCDVNATIERLKDLTQNMEAPALSCPDPRNVVSNILLSLGVSTKLRGYACLREAILEVSRDPSQQITKSLYPKVAEIVGGNKDQVERAIRSAIEAAWRRRDDLLWREFFIPDADGNIPRPSNATFISAIADRISRGWEPER